MFADCIAVCLSHAHAKNRELRNHLRLTARSKSDRESVKQGGNFERATTFLHTGSRSLCARTDHAPKIVPEFEYLHTQSREYFFCPSWRSDERRQTYVPLFIMYIGIAVCGAFSDRAHKSYPQLANREKERERDV